MKISDLELSGMSCCLRTNPTPYYNANYAICRVKFGVPLEQVCKRDIPGPLLVSRKKLIRANNLFLSYDLYPIR